MRISDWSSDVCSSDLVEGVPVHDLEPVLLQRLDVCRADQVIAVDGSGAQRVGTSLRLLDRHDHGLGDLGLLAPVVVVALERDLVVALPGPELERRSEEHTSELQSLMSNSNAGFCLETKKN